MDTTDKVHPDFARAQRLMHMIGVGGDLTLDYTLAAFDEVRAASEARTLERIGAWMELRARTIEKKGGECGAAMVRLIATAIREKNWKVPG